MSSRIPRIVEGHAETLAVLAVALLVTLLEVVLLNAKYEAFSGGFLQSYELATGTARAVFVAEILLPLAFVLRSGRGVRTTATALYVLLILASSLLLSPEAY